MEATGKVTHVIEAIESPAYRGAATTHSDRDMGGAMPAILSEWKGLQEDQTVNAVIQRYPHARLVFERFFINVRFEGQDCLDEVAWRRGMASSELIAQLTQVLTEQGGAHAVPATGAEEILRQSSTSTV